MPPSPSTDLTCHLPPALLTEREARIAGATSTRLCGLRGMLKQGISGGSLTVSTPNGNQSLTLNQVDTQALIGLLMERDEQFLIALNIELER